MIESTPNAREAAYLAVLASVQEQGYAAESLERWQRSQQPKPTDISLARHIAYGTIQMANSLDHMAMQLTNTGKLNIKAKERLLLRSALFQAHFMERIPLYSIVNESVKLARKYFHPGFAKFLNALLRAYDTKKPSLPSQADPESWSTHYSYPHYYVDKLIAAYGLSQAQEILALGNLPAKAMVRIRQQGLEPLGSTLIHPAPLPVVRVADATQLAELTTSPDYYVQNVTPVYLIAKLAKVSKCPKRILDLCAAPGGKSIAVHDLYPEAHLVANDASEARLKSLHENLQKFGITASVTCRKGELYPTDEKFDLIILDVPCSNSGVLNKRPEARWRLTPEALGQLEILQNTLLDHATRLLAPAGQIWYLTCSLLPSENEELIAKACQRLRLKVGPFMKTCLPNQEGWDGGFGCLLA